MIARLARYRIHPSWLIAALSAGVLLGAVTARYEVVGDEMALGWLVSAVLLMGYSLWRQRWWCLVLCIVAGSLVGYTRAAQIVRSQQVARQHYGQTITLRGTVLEDVTRAAGSTTMTLGALEVNGRATAGKVWASLPAHDNDQAILRSDRVELRGVLQPGFATFVGTMNNQASIAAVTRANHADSARELRDWFAGGVTRVIAHPEADLGLGFVVGEKRALPSDLLDALKIVGLTHVIVASGYNLTILVRLARRLLARYSKFAAFAGAVAMVVAFMLVTGFSPSMSRAGIVTGLSLAAWYYGRTVHPFVLLVFAAAITVLIDPTYAWGDAGWLLSFSAFAGVIVVAPLLTSYFFGKNQLGTAGQVLIETTSAQLVTLPVIMCLFGQFSVVALAANLLILPLIPLAMLLVFVSGVLTLMQAPFIGLVSVPASWLLHYMIWVAQQLASLSWASLQVSVSASVAVLLYVLLALGGVYIWRKTRLPLHAASVIE